MAFVIVPGVKPPDRAEEIWVTAPDGAALRTMVSPTHGPVRGSVILCNGRTEFIEKYFEVARELQARDFCVFTMDWRGQGLSARETKNRLKGHYRSFDDPAADLGVAVAAHADRLPRPHIVVAHSMGGCISLRALQTGAITAQAALFNAPMWGIKAFTPTAVRAAQAFSAIGIGKSFVPGSGKHWARAPFKANALTHDVARYELAQDVISAEPKLALAGITFGWAAAAARVHAEFRKPGALAHLDIPITVISAGAETLVTNESHEEIARLLPRAKHVTIPGAMHEVLMEQDPIRERFWSYFDELADQVASEVKLPGGV